MELSVIVSQLLQLFLVIFLGYFLYKVHIFDQALNKRITSILLKVTLPATIINSVISQSSRPPQSEVLLTFAAAIGMYILLPIVSLLMVKLLRLPKNDQGMYLFMSTYANVGFMGFPVISAIYGNEAIFYAAIFNVLFNVSCFSLGILMMNIGKKEKTALNLKTVLLSPATISSLLAVVIYVIDIPFPKTLSSAISSVGSITTPLAMMLIGSTLATMSIREVFNDWHVYPFAVVRQFLLPLLVWPFLVMAIPNDYVLGITFVMLIMPVANTSVLFATQYGNNEQLAAKTVFLTTLMTLVTIPVLLYLCVR